MDVYHYSNSLKLYILNVCRKEEDKKAHIFFLVDCSSRSLVVFFIFSNSPSMRSSAK